MIQRDPLQQTMVGDFHKILANSDVLNQFYHDLPEQDRRVVENYYLEWAWQIVMGAASFHQNVPDDQVPEFVRSFGGFVLACQKGQSLVFETSDWVAIDRRTFDQLAPTLRELRDELKKHMEDAPNDGRPANS